MTNNHAPAISVIIPASGPYGTIRKTIKHLHAQTVKDQLEIIVVTPGAASFKVDEADITGFHQFRVLEAGHVRSNGAAYAKGIRDATAPVVALGEDHAYPAVGWAEALIRAHRQPWAAVCPVVCNANDPRSAIAWADAIIGFGEWLIPEAGRIARVPANNSSYKRAVLLAYGPELDAMMEELTLFQQEFQRRGWQAYLEPAAKLAHLNFERLSSFIKMRLLSGRCVGAVRSRGWSVPRRLLYACGAFLIPVIVYLRIARSFRVLHREGRLPWGVMPIIVCGLVILAVGESVGYLCGGVAFPFDIRRSIPRP